MAESAHLRHGLLLLAESITGDSTDQVQESG
jgi:hypothetical protein